MITYIARNISNGKFYIGSTLDFEKRKRQHLLSKENYPFQNALRQNPDIFEWEIIEDKSSERILEQSLLDMWFGKEICYNLNSKANNPPIVDKEINYSNGKNVENMKLGFHNPEYRNSKKYKKMQMDTGKKCAELKIGIHSEEYKKSNRSKEVSSNNGKITGKRNFLNKKGIFDPNYKNSQKFIEDTKKRLERTKEVCSKSIIIIEPNGKEYTFYSMNDAERKLGIKNQTISRTAKRGTAITKGKWKGWKVIYQES